MILLYRIKGEVCVKKGLKIILALFLATVIGAGGFVIFKSSQGISYDISSLGKMDSDIEIVSETEDGVTVRKKSGGIQSADVYRYTS